MNPFSKFFTIHQSPVTALYFTFFILHFSFVFSQQNKTSGEHSRAIDSLLTLLETDKQDTAKVIHLYSLCDKYRNKGNYDTALYYGNAALQLAQKLTSLSGLFRQGRGEGRGWGIGIAFSYNNIGLIYWNQGNYDKALENYFASLKIAEGILIETKELFEKRNAQKSIATSYNNIGIIYYEQDNYEKALENYFASLKIAEGILSEVKELSEKRDVQKSVASTYNNIGAIYYYQGDYDKALENYFASLKIKEEIGDNNGIAYSYNNIGNIYNNQGNYDKALENYFASLKIDEEFGNKQGIAYSYNNIGIIYYNQGNYDKALENYFASLKIDEELGDKQGIAFDYNSIGIIYKEQGNYDKALKNYFASLKIKEEIGDKQGIAVSYNNIGNLYLKQNKLAEAKKQSLAGLSIAKEIGAKDQMMNAYYSLSQCDSVAGNWKGAYQYHKLYSQIKDTIFNEENSKQMAEMQTRYETEKKEKEIALQKAEIVKKEAVIKQQNIQRIALASGFALMLALAFVVFRAYRNKQKANKIISAQKAEVERQKSVIEEKNKNITDSIEYASYIQKTVLPTDDEFYRLFPEAFILYKPRDIVSGDFYWMTQLVGSQSRHQAGAVSKENSNNNQIQKVENKQLPIADCPLPPFLLALGDCTGHGVPGAFMSMLCTALLNEAVHDKCLTKPNEILNDVRNGIISALKQREGGGGSKDGMDCVLIELKIINEKLKIMNATCANNPIYIVSNGDITEIKTDRQPVGFSYNPKSFTLHEIELQKGDMIYTLTDGYEDQLGGEKGKKFKSAKLKEILISIASKSVTEQKEILEKAFKEWKGSGEQTDDVTVIGIRI